MTCSVFEVEGPSVPVIGGEDPFLPVMAGEGPPSTRCGAGLAASINDRETRLRRLRIITAEIRASMGNDLPSSDHSWLYDDQTGLPR